MDVEAIQLSAGVRTRITKQGRFFMLVETTAALDVGFERNLGTLPGVGRSVEAGYVKFPGNWADPNDGLFDAIILTSPVLQTVRIGTSFTAADYRRIAVPVQLEQANTAAGESLGSVSATVVGQQLWAAASGEKRYVLSNDATVAGDDVRIGTADDATGFLLRAGERLEILAESIDIYAVKAGANNVPMTIWVERRVA